jgi:hypothetical protein
MSMEWALNTTAAIGMVLVSLGAALVTGGLLMTAVAMFVMSRKG